LSPITTFDLIVGARLSLIVIWCIGINRAIHHRDQLSHLALGKPTKKPLDKIFLLNHGNKMSLQKGRLGQTCLTRLHSLRCRARRPVTAKRDREYGAHALTRIACI